MSLRKGGGETVDVAIVGAGPYGLSLSAHLRGHGVEHRIFGEPMDAWKNGMPPGMLLKSYPWASSLSAPDDGFSVKQFCAERIIPYHDELMPLPLERFLDYAEAFRQRHAPDVERRTLTALEPGPDGFRARFDDGATVLARRVVVAVGLQSFRQLPPQAGHLPDEVRSHSGQYGVLDALDGKEVIVVGSGASATDLAALLTDRGSSVTVVAREPRLDFAARPRPRTLIERTTTPMSGIGTGWAMGACAKYPHLIRLLSEEMRVQIANGKAWGPSGSAFARDRVMGKVPLHLGQTIEKAEVRAGRVVLDLVDAAGGRRSVRGDHVVFATGYKVDVGRLSFLDHRTLGQMRQIDHAPDLSSHYETSVPGLHFVGPAAANSFGPVCRFVYGSHHAARHLSKHLARNLSRTLSGAVGRHAPPLVAATTPVTATTHREVRP